MLWPLTVIAGITVVLLASVLVLARLVAYFIGRARKAPTAFLHSVESAYHEGRAESEHDTHG